MDRVLMLAVLLLAPVVSAAEVYRCSGHGRVSYQDHPCAGALQQRVWQPAAPLRVPPAAATTPTRRAPQPAATTAGARRPVSGRQRGAGTAGRAALISLRADAQRCERVRQQRAQALGQRRRGPDLLAERAWNDRVYDACR